MEEFKWVPMPKIGDNQSLHISGKVVYMTANGRLMVTRQPLTTWFIDKYNLVKYIILPNE